MKNNRISIESNLLDDSAVSKHKNVDWKYYSYFMFSILVFGLGIFLILKPLQENYPVENLPNGLISYFFVLIIIGLGTIFINDGIQIKRAITVNKHFL